MNNLSVFYGANVLVTGHTGFKGAWLSLWLAQLGARVSGVSLGLTSNPTHFVAAGLDSRVEDIRADIRDGPTLNILVNKIKPDFVFHLAAQALVRTSYGDPFDTWQTNCMGTINLLESLRGLSNPCVAILITSDKCYDNVEWTWGYRETDTLGGADPYSASKAAAELAIKSYVRSFFSTDGLVRIGVGRAGNVIGGGDWAIDRLVPDCVRAWSCGESVALRNPISTRPWQHVLEPLSGYLALAISLKESAKLHGEAFNFGPPAQQNQSVGELVSSMATHWERVMWTDISEMYEGPYESGLLKLNCDKALNQLGWMSTWNFQETVRETVLWYKHYYENPSKSIAHFSLSQISEFVDSARLKRIWWAE